MESPSILMQDIGTVRKRHCKINIEVTVGIYRLRPRPQADLDDYAHYNALDTKTLRMVEWCHVLPRANRCAESARGIT